MCSTGRSRSKGASHKYLRAENPVKGDVERISNRGSPLQHTLNQPISALDLFCESQHVYSVIPTSKKVEGDPAGKTNGGPPKKRGRLLIEEVDTPQVTNPSDLRNPARKLAHSLKRSRAQRPTRVSQVCGGGVDVRWKLSDHTVRIACWVRLNLPQQTHQPSILLCSFYEYLILDWKLNSFNFVNTPTYLHVLPNCQRRSARWTLRS